MTVDTKYQLRAATLLLGVIILTTGCVKRVPAAVVTATQNYVIVKYDDAHFAIRADSSATAERAATDILGCKKSKGNVCIYSPGGIVLFVERPVQPTAPQGPAARK